MATMALHDTHFLALLSQALTALTVEAMVGHVGSFHPFIHDVTRPHPGQIEVARNIRTSLAASSFAIQSDAEVAIKDDEGVLRQDRYPLRTAAQWLGPALSDLVGSHEILKIELNSTTDNPLIDIQNDIVHSGGNFQSVSVCISHNLQLTLAVQGDGRHQHHGEDPPRRRADGQAQLCADDRARQVGSS